LQRWQFEAFGFMFPSRNKTPQGAAIGFEFIRMDALTATVTTFPDHFSNPGWPDAYIHLARALACFAEGGAVPQ
jgi:hypothetical protein